MLFLNIFSSFGYVQIIKLVHSGFQLEVTFLWCTINLLWSEHRISDENLSSMIDIIYFRVQDVHGHYFIPTSTHHTGTWQRVFFDLR